MVAEHHRRLTLVEYFFCAHRPSSSFLGSPHYHQFSGSPRRRHKRLGSQQIHGKMSCFVSRSTVHGFFRTKEGGRNVVRLLDVLCRLVFVIASFTRFLCTGRTYPLSAATVSNYFDSLTNKRIIGILCPVYASSGSRGNKYSSSSAQVADKCSVIKPVSHTHC